MIYSIWKTQSVNNELLQKKKQIKKRRKERLDEVIKKKESFKISQKTEEPKKKTK